ncbi:MAG: hypothetical protein ABIT05_12830 [Chitinophagaceae bacterium]
MKLKPFIAMAAVVIFVACGTPYRATDTGVVVVPETTQRSFVVQYPAGSNATWSYYNHDVVILNDWEMSGWAVPDVRDYVVQFDQDNEKYYAWYDSDGTWIGTAYVVRDYSRLPMVVTATLARDYSDYSISSVNREYYKDRNAYEIVMKRPDGSKVVLLVDNDGRVLKSKIK